MPEAPLIVRDDFKAFSKIRIENHMYNECARCRLSPPVTCASSLLPAKFKFKEYCPVVFRDLRSRFGISSEDFMVGPRFAVFVHHAASRRSATGPRS